VLDVETTRAEPGAEYCGAFPGLSAAGARVPCTPGECATERICRALKRLGREADLARARGRFGDEPFGAVESPLRGTR
jgi:hypothetical protein